jgi:hypothetical protein
MFDVDQGGIIAGVLPLACRYVLSEFVTVYAEYLFLIPMGANRVVEPEPFIQRK